MDKNKQRLIYALYCPFTYEIHYVGKSTSGMLRPLSHLRDSHSDKIREWVANLKELGYKPSIKILEYVAYEEDIDGRERYWIQYYLNNNSLLLNSVLISPLLVSPDLDQLLGNDEDMIPLKIGTFVKEKRKMFKLGQPEFATKSGVALTVIRKIEQGKTNLNLDSLLQVLQMFGCTLDVIKAKKE
jgi:y4mF family transcriptional regulator